MRNEPLLINILVFSPLQLHKQADMQEEKNRIERVLGAISQPELIQKVLTFALSVSSWANLPLPGRYSQIFPGNYPGRGAEHCECGKSQIQKNLRELVPNEQKSA